LCLVIMGQPIICFFVKLLLASYWSMCMMHFHDLKIKLQIDLAIPSLIIKLGDGYCFFFFFAPELAFLLQPAKVTCYFYKIVHTKAEKEVRKTEHEKKSCFPC